MMNDDMDLIREYAAHQSEPAFETLVGRYLNLVYATAARRVGNLHLAEEVAQAVFILLARKAHTLGPNTVLPSWLHRTAGYVAADALKIERRRAQREQEAHMQTMSNEPAAEDSSPIVPLLDAAIDRLNEKDRRAIVLRFFQAKSLNEVALATGVSEEAAKKRVNRALEKLRKIFLKHGVNSTTAIIAGGISSSALQTAPMPLIKTVAAIAAAKGAAAPASTLLMIQGALKQMAWAKWKLAIDCGAALFVAGTVAVTALPKAHNSTLDDNNGRYEIDGVLTYAPGGATVTRNFTLTVNGSNWMVHLTRTQPDPALPIDIALPGTPLKLDYRQQYDEEVGFNGSVYLYTYYGKLPPEAAPARNNGVATIDYGESAVEDGSFANYVWAGLASGYYYSRNTNGEVTPVNRLTSTPRKNQVKAVCQLNDTAPYLPKSIDYYNEPIQGIQLGPGVISHQFDSGWKAGELRVQNEQTINGKTFPTDYTYEQFRPNFAAGTTTNTVEQYLVTVHVQKIHLHAVPDVLPPKLNGDTAAIDRRYVADRQQTPVHFPFPPGRVIPDGLYFTSSGRLPKEPDVKAIREYEQERQTRIR